MKLECVASTACTVSIDCWAGGRRCPWPWFRREREIRHPTKVTAPARSSSLYLLYLSYLLYALYRLYLLYRSLVSLYISYLLYRYILVPPKPSSFSSWDGGTSSIIPGHLLKRSAPQRFWHGVPLTFGLNRRTARLLLGRWQVPNRHHSCMVGSVLLNVCCWGDGRYFPGAGSG